jgi:hypothetical protein
MDNPQEKRNLAEAKVIINHDEPPRRSPPSLSVGPVGWIRENLFGSPFDAILTILSAILIVATTVGLLTWSVQSANWLAVNQNFRNFMAGTYPIESIWRLNTLVYLSAFVTGLTIATYSRAGRGALVTIGLILLALFALPVIVRAVLPNPSTFIAAGVVDIQSGTVTESPTDTVAFTALAGTNVRVQVATQFEGDEQTVTAGGFGDRPVRAYFNAAQNRLDDLARVDEIERTLAANERVSSPFLSCSQFLDLKREMVALQRTLNPLALSEEAAAFEVDDATLLSCEESIVFPETDFATISSLYDVNQSTVDVSLLKGDTLELLGETTLTSGGDVLTVTIPETGWYVLQSQVADEGVLMVLDAVNIYPLIERAVVQVRTGEDGEPILNVNTGNVEQDTIQEYVNIYTQDVTRLEPPVITVEGEADDVQLLRLTDAKYVGERPFNDYMTLSLGPLFDRMDMASLWFAVFGVIGYGAGIGIKRTTPRVPGAGMAGVATLGSWTLFTFLLFLLTIGVTSLNGIGLGNLAGMIVWVGIMFFLGMTYNLFGKSIGQPLLGLGLVMILGHIIVYRMTIDPRPAFGTADEAGWILSSGFIIQLILWVVIGLGAFQTGVGNESALGTGSRRLGFFSAVGLWIVLIAGTPIVVNLLAGTPLLTNYGSENLLPIAEMRLWGGFLLTFMLTAVGIVASFPIGVLLALGRRAAPLPGDQVHLHYLHRVCAWGAVGIGVVHGIAVGSPT